MRLSSISRIFTLGVVAFGLHATSAAPVHARPAICGKLERQLATLSGAPGNNKYANAASAQSKQLQIARAQARANGCNGGLFAAGAKSAACTKITSTIRRMEANLSSLKAKSGSRISASTSRSRILAALDANDCDNKGAIVQKAKIEKLKPATAKKNPGLLTMLFGGERVERRLPNALDDAKPKRILSERPANADNSASIKTIKVTHGSLDGVNYSVGSGNFRTVCVRTCDGYYFPVSFSSSSSKFSLDSKLCQQMCPGTEVALYVHHAENQESEDMVSLTGEPYASLPTAFNYRVDGPGKTAGCSCQAPAVAASLKDGETGRQAGAELVKWIPYPVAKPAAMTDEESRLNFEGKLDAAAIRYLIEPKTTSTTSRPNEDIRVVGPVFFPAQVQAEAEQVPDQTTVR